MSALYTDHIDAGPESIPAFLEAAIKLDAGQDAYRAVDHLTAREKGHLSRYVGGCRPIQPWIEDKRAIAAEAIRAVCS